MSVNISFIGIPLVFLDHDIRFSICAFKLKAFKEKCDIDMICKNMSYFNIQPKQNMAVTTR